MTRLRTGNRRAARARAKRAPVSSHPWVELKYYPHQRAISRKQFGLHAEDSLMGLLKFAARRMAADMERAALQMKEEGKP